MGDASSRERYREVLLAYWHDHADLIGAEMERAEANPLRILDSKRSDWSEMLERAPQLGEYLSDESAAHFAHVQEGLQALGIPFEISPRLVRGFDYYTGTVYEGIMQGHESLGAVCSGGRYDNLAAGAREPLPGVGISIGVSRILGRLFGQGLLPAERKTPTAVLVALPSDSERAAALSVVRALRARGIPAETYHEAAKLGKQMKYAGDKGIPYVWLPFPDRHEVRDMASGEQAPADAASWAPAA
jgi:histidyl-tRNA synthetase